MPLIIGITALKSDAILIRSFSARMPSEFIVYHNLISKLCSLSAGLLTIGLQVTLLPNLIESIARKDYQRSVLLVKKAKIITLSLSAALAVLVYFMAPLVIKVLFVGGKFSVRDYEIAISLLPYYIVPMLGWGIVSIYVQPLYALKKHLHVGVIGLSFLFLGWLSSTVIQTVSPTSYAICVGLSVLLLGTSLGADLIWKINIKKLFP